MIALFKQYKLIALAAAVLALMALSAAGAWKWQANSYERQLSELQGEHQTFLRQVAEANAAVILKQQKERQALADELASLDQQRYGELRHAQQEIDRLSAAVADGTRRLSVRAACPAAGADLPRSAVAAGLDDGAQRADIHPTDAGRIIAITGDADACAVKLSALQEWARTITAPGR